MTFLNYILIYIYLFFLFSLFSQFATFYTHLEARGEDESLGLERKKLDSSGSSSSFIFLVKNAFVT